VAEPDVELRLRQGRSSVERPRRRAGRSQPSPRRTAPACPPPNRAPRGTSPSASSSQASP